MTQKQESDVEQDAAPKSPAKVGGSKRTTARKRSQTSTAPKAGSGKGGRAASSTRGSKSSPTQSARRGTPRGTAKAAAPPEPSPGEAPVQQSRPLPRLMARFREEIVPTLMREFGYASPMQVPRPSKVVLNIGLGEALENPRAIENATRDLTMISGQRPVTTRARKSIASFKIREGMPIGLMVSLRGRRMYEFLDRLISSTLPRIRDFRGLPRDAFDGRGNYSLGIREQIIFPEIDYNSIDRIRGLQVAIVTTATGDPEGLRLMELLGLPLARAIPEAGAA